MKKKEALGILPKNVVVVAGEKTVMLEEFSGIRTTTDDPEKAFFLAVDPNLLKRHSYVNLLEIITFAMRKAFGQSPVSTHPYLEIVRDLGRLITIIPRAKPVKNIRDIYKAQIRVLLSL